MASSRSPPRLNRRKAATTWAGPDVWWLLVSRIGVDLLSKMCPLIPQQSTYFCARTCVCVCVCIKVSKQGLHADHAGRAPINECLTTLSYLWPGPRQRCLTPDTKTKSKGHASPRTCIVGLCTTKIRFQMMLSTVGGHMWSCSKCLQFDGSFACLFGCLDHDKYRNLTPFDLTSDTTLH